MRPVIGITAYIELITRDVWVDQRSAVVPQAYIDHVQRAGAIAVVIPPRADADDEFVDAVLSRVDGLILTGGVDVAPELYGQDRHATVQASRPDRDVTDIAFARHTAERDIPLLGICRGMQVMAVAAGGALEQHTPDRVGHQGHSPTPGRYAWHTVSTDPTSRIGQRLDSRMSVPTHHHQSVLTHPGYRASAWADDATIEAIEYDDARFRVGVQWHPEVSEDNRLFVSLVTAARERAGLIGMHR